MGKHYFFKNERLTIGVVYAALLAVCLWSSDWMAAVLVAGLIASFEYVFILEEKIQHLEGRVRRDGPQ